MRFTSCEVRKPSKKCRNGTRARSVAACATSAKSCASCTDDAHSIAKPVVRAAITSLWSPKIESACVATVRAATCSTQRRELARDLEQVRAASAAGPATTVKLVASAPRCTRAVQHARGARLALHLDHLGHGAPQVGLAPRAPGVGPLAHRRGRRDRVDRDRPRRAGARRAPPPRCRPCTRCSVPLRRSFGDRRTGSRAAARGR